MNQTIVGIHTGVGKTVASAILVEALECSYWKPIQAGELQNSDTDFVRKYTNVDESRIIPEVFRLNTPASPHHAARLDGVEINLSDFDVPLSNRPLIIETAGGLMSPVNDSLTNLDLVKKLGFPCVLVVSDYLGSINHTLMTCELMRLNRIKVSGLIFSGKAVESSRTLVLKQTKLPLICELPEMNLDIPDVVINQARILKDRILEVLL